MHKHVQRYFDTLHKLICDVACSDRTGRILEREEAFEASACFASEAVNAGRKIMFIGNGGSAGIASHMAIDFSKNGAMRATAFNDGAALTCLANDFGYEHAFAKQIEYHAVPGDVLIAISSSGRSKSIVNAVQSARRAGCVVLTYSGFDADNTLRSMGDVNYYIQSHEYGMVELAHASLIHAIADLKVAGVLARSVEAVVSA